MKSNENDCKREMHRNREGEKWKAGNDKLQRGKKRTVDEGKKICIRIHRMLIIRRRKKQWRRNRTQSR